MNRRVEEVVIATYATKGNLRRIRVTIDRDGTYSYSEWHRLRLVGRGANYSTRTGPDFCLIYSLPPRATMSQNTSPSSIH